MAAQAPVVAEEHLLCAGLRVLECSSAIGTAYAGWLLARMGAEVVRSGDIAALPPACDRAQHSFGYLFAHLDSGKPLLDSASNGRHDVMQLIGECDILLLDSEAACTARWGVSLQQLRARHPALVIGVSTLMPLMKDDSADATGLAAQAVGGIAWAIGEPGRAPLPYPPGVLDHQAGVHLAAAVLVAIHSRQTRGHGERVDVSLAQVLAYCAYSNALGQLPWGLKWERAGPRAFGSGGAYPYTLLPCKDGLVCLICRSREEWQRLVVAMGSPAWAEQPRYKDLRAMGTEYPQEVDDLIRPWLAQKTRAELLEISREHSIPMSPVCNFAEVLATPQFAFRAALEVLGMPEGEARAPGLPFQVRSPTGLPDEDGARPGLKFGAPRAFSGWVQPRTEAQPRAATTTTKPAQPLENLRVLDLGWVWSAPLAAGILSQFGAEVIKVEHGGKLDNMRMRGRPRRADGSAMEGPSIELSPSFHQINHNKRGITLDLKTPEALALLKQLAAQSDVLIENMSPGAAQRAGLGYDVLAAINPRLIMISLSAAGQFGPGADMRAYAPVMSSFTGLEGLIGYRGETPVGAMNIGFPDPNAAAHALVALLAALHRRERTGKGCYIDLSQIECLLSTLSGSVIEASLGGQPSSAGASHPDMAPHGVYPAAGPDRWITLAVAADAPWRALCNAIGPAGLVMLATYVTGAQRLAARAQIDATVAAWTATQDRDWLCERLRAVGVAAWPVLDIAEVRQHAVFNWRDAVREVSHPVTGAESIVIAPWRFEHIRAEVVRSSPLLGEHNEEVLRGVAGLSADAYGELVARGVIR